VKWGGSCGLFKVLFFHSFERTEEKHKQLRVFSALAENWIRYLLNTSQTHCYSAILFRFSWWIKRKDGFRQILYFVYTMSNIPWKKNNIMCHLLTDDQLFFFCFPFVLSSLHCLSIYILHLPYVYLGKFFIFERPNCVLIWYIPIL